MSNSESKMFLVDSNNGNSYEFKSDDITVFGVDMAIGPDRTGCLYINPTKKISGTLLFDKKTSDSFKLAFAERNLKILQSLQYHKARPGRIRRRIKSLKRKIRTVKNRHFNDTEWLKNIEVFRNFI